MNDPWTQTTVWGLTVEVGVGLGGGGQRGKIRTEEGKGEKLGQL